MADVRMFIQRWLKLTSADNLVDDQDTEEERDRISQLPDSILQCILSLLPPRYATRTMVLSKHWQGLWDRLSRQEEDLQALATIAKPRQDYFHMRFNSFDSSLTLIGYGLDVVDDDMKRSLRKFFLVNVMLSNEKSLESVISGCRLIEELDLCFLDGLKLGGSHWRQGLPAMAACKTLKRLTLQIPNITDEWFQSQVLCKLPLLEDLRLMRCYMLERLDISSPKLKCLWLVKCHRLQEIKVETPLLDWFVYVGRNVISFSSTEINANWSYLSASIHLYIEDHNEGIRLLQLVADLVKFSHGNFEIRVNCISKQLPMDECFLLNLSMENTSGGDVTIPEELKGNFLPPFVGAQKLSLDITVKQASFREFVAPKRNWCPCYPDCLPMLSKSDNQFMEYLCEETWGRDETYVKNTQ